MGARVWAGESWQQAFCGASGPPVCRQGTGLLPAGSWDASTQRHADGSRMGAADYTWPLPGSHWPPRCCKAVACMCALLCTSPGGQDAQRQVGHGKAQQPILPHPSDPAEPQKGLGHAWRAPSPARPRFAPRMRQLTQKNAAGPRSGEGPRSRHTLWLARAGPPKPGCMLPGPCFHRTEATLPTPGGWGDEHLLANGDPPLRLAPKD